MTEFADVKTKYLSGQQQRVALARVLALEPEILLDEPFSHIDNFRKMPQEICLLFEIKWVTCIVATHDSTDAFLC
jgi:ABC-type nitrate/sulfonate/bicarbonate transport system ATPase subunit